jgi:hypothetical protein
MRLNAFPERYARQIIEAVRATVRPDAELIHSSPRSLIVRVFENGVPNQILGYPFRVISNSWLSLLRRPEFAPESGSAALREVLEICSTVLRNEPNAIWVERMTGNVSIKVRHDRCNVYGLITDDQGKVISLRPIDLSEPEN